MAALITLASIIAGTLVSARSKRRLFTSAALDCSTTSAFAGEKGRETLPSTAASSAANQKQIIGTPESNARTNVKIDPNSRCWLLSLPAELRISIYEYVMVDEPPYDIYPQPPYSAPTQPALTRASRQLRQETLPIHYTWSKFRCFDSGGEITAKSLGPWTSQLRLIKAVTICPCHHLDYYHLTLHGSNRYHLGVDREHRAGFSETDPEDLLKKLWHRHDHLQVDRGFLDARAAWGSFDERLNVEVLAQLVDTVNCKELQLDCAVCKVQQS